MADIQLNVVRGYGPLDRFIASIRHRIARKKLRVVKRRRCLLDIGCGNYPLFLREADFEQKYGIDKQINKEAQKYAEQHGVRISEHDIAVPGKLPFGDDFFDAVTMLAVFEHIYPEYLVPLLTEIRRILKPEGLFVMTTPAFWTDRLLRAMASLKLISAEEITDHKGAYKCRDIQKYLILAGFDKTRIKTGHFELYMNSWATAEK